jgi:GH15 family glucan-1,4-alpha-glucosidase
VPAMIEDYGLIGDMQSAALISRGGSVDWLCLPRFDSPACLAALLGSDRNGRWRIAPSGAADDFDEGSASPAVTGATP